MKIYRYNKTTMELLNTLDNVDNYGVDYITYNHTGFINEPDEIEYSTLEDLSERLRTPLLYDKRVPELIREQYSQNDENKLMNKAILNAEDTEYLTYRAFVDTCKTQAKTELGIV